MSTCFDNLNNKKLIIGLVHLLPMLGTPLYENGNLEKMTKKAIEDCLTLKKNGADGGLIQTVDVYYPSTDDTDYARVAGLAAIVAAVTRLAQVFSLELKLCGIASPPPWLFVKPQERTLRAVRL